MNIVMSGPRSFAISLLSSQKQARFTALFYYSGLASFFLQHSYCLQSYLILFHVLVINHYHERMIFGDDAQIINHSIVFILDINLSFDSLFLPSSRSFISARLHMPNSDEVIMRLNVSCRPAPKFLLSGGLVAQIKILVPKTEYALYLVIRGAQTYF